MGVSGVHYIVLNRHILTGNFRLCNNFNIYAIIISNTTTLKMRKNCGELSLKFSQMCQLC